MDLRPVALRKFEKSPGWYGLAAAHRIAAGDFVISVAGPVVGERTRYSLQIDASRHVDGGDARGLDDDLNHACSPNAFVTFPALEVRALRDIDVGEEVTINYCATEEELVAPFACRCGGPRCYGDVRGFRHLDRAQREALQDIVSPWLKARYGL